MGTPAAEADWAQVVAGPLAGGDLEGAAQPAGRWRKSTPAMLSKACCGPTSRSACVGLSPHEARASERVLPTIMGLGKTIQVLSLLLVS